MKTPEDVKKQIEKENSIESCLNRLSSHLNHLDNWIYPSIVNISKTQFEQLKPRILSAGWKNVYWHETTDRNAPVKGPFIVISSL